MKVLGIFAFLLNFYSILLSSLVATQSSQNPVIIVTDGGADDATALIQVLEDPSVKVLAIICSYGNVPLEQSCNNTLRTLELMDKADEVPVYAGSDSPFSREAEYDGFYGWDGFGNNSYKFPLPNQKVRSQHGANAINSYINAYQDEVTILSLGPLTDLAVALKLDSSLPSKLKNVFIMGGSSRAVGNVGPVSEFNINLDPEAARAVIRGYYCPVTIIPYELCVDFSPTWEWFDVWVSSNNTIAFFISEVFEIARQSAMNSGEEFGDCDLMTATVFLYPEVVTDSAMKWADAEPCGTVTQGEFVVDNRPGNRSVPNVEMMLGLDQDLLLQKWQDVVEYDVTSGQVEKPLYSFF